MSKKRRLPFPLEYYPKYAAVFIRGEVKEKGVEWVREQRKKAVVYEKVVEQLNRDLIKVEKEFDLSFCKYPPLPHQTKPLAAVMAFEKVFIHGDIGCVDGDTEFLTPRGWKKIKDYREGEPICEVEFIDPSRCRCYFRVPLDYIELPTTHFFVFRAGEAELFFSEEHMMPIYHNGGISLITPPEIIIKYPPPFINIPVVVDQDINCDKELKLIPEPILIDEKNIKLRTYSCSEPSWKYCFTTHTGFWLARRDGKIFPTGNSGKTYVAGYAAVRRLRSDKCKRVLIVCPKVAIQQWMDELNKFFEIPPEWFGDRIVVTNYESLYHHTAPENTPVEFLVKEEFKDRFDSIVVDESHLIKNPYTVSACVVCHLLKGTKYRILMTGTPIRNMANDLYLQLSVINPWAFKMSYWHFMRTFFTEVKMGQFSKWVLKPQKVPILNQIVLRNAIRMIKPPKDEGRKTVFNMVKVKPSRKQLQMAEAIANEALEVRGKLVELKNKLMKIQQISSGFLIYERDRKSVLVDRFESSKIDKAVQMITDYARSGEKVVVFARFHETIDRLLSELYKNGVRAEAMTGKLTAYQTEKVKDNFLHGKTGVLIIQIKKGELALNLQVARRVVFVEYDWIPALVEQCIGRVDREGQTRTVYVDFLMTEGLLDDKMVQVVQQKNKITSRILRTFAASLVTRLSTFRK